MRLWADDVDDREISMAVGLHRNSVVQLKQKLSVYQGLEVG